MRDENRLPVALLALRLSVFLVMFIWTLDKFTNPAHAARVFEHFYFLQGFGPAIVYTIGAAELLIVLGFLLGIRKRLTYGAVLLFHAMSTIMPIKMYFNLQEGLLFYAAWPMLGACFALYLLRESDTMWNLSADTGQAQQPAAGG